MSWPTIARKDFEDAVRSRFYWAAVAAFSLLTAVLVGVAKFLPGAEATAALGLGIATEFAGILVPIIALIAAYLSIAGERENGSIKVLLGLPPSRADVVLGKLVGRLGVVLLGVVAGFVLSGVTAFAVYGELPVGAFLSITALTGVLALAFVAVAVGISAATATRARAMAASIGVYLLFTVMWDFIPYGVHVAVYGRPPGATVPAWYFLVERLSPPGAYGQAIGRILSADGGGMTPPLTARIDGALPAYLGDGALVVIFASWIALPVLLGYLRFRRADL